MHTIEQPSQTPPAPRLWVLFRIWASIGLQSFGGGATTTFLIQHAFIDKRQWMTMEEFTHLWNLCVMVPGINLIALTILIGRKFGGTGGIIVSLLGMLLPSAMITCGIAAGFKIIEQAQATQNIIKGVIPATAAIMLLVGIKFAQPQMKLARTEGPLSTILCLLFVVVSIIALAIFNISAILILPAAAILGAVLFTVIRRPQTGKDASHD